MAMHFEWISGMTSVAELQAGLLPLLVPALRRGNAGDGRSASALVSMTLGMHVSAVRFIADRFRLDKPKASQYKHAARGK
jgi:hypothetical protein